MIDYTHQAILRKIADPIASGETFRRIEAELLAHTPARRILRLLDLVQVAGVGSKRSEPRFVARHALRFLPDTTGLALNRDITKDCLKWGNVWSRESIDYAHETRHLLVYSSDPLPDLLEIDILIMYLVGVELDNEVGALFMDVASVVFRLWCGISWPATWYPANPSGVDVLIGTLPFTYINKVTF